jgi:uncharacterized heparinase superfamily protein
MSPGRLWRTLRWLKTEQIVGRIRFRLARSRPDLRAPPPRRELPAAAATSGSAVWAAPPAREPSLVGPTGMRFLGVEHDLAECGWDDPALPLLWRYNQHYFDDLNAQGAAARREWQLALVDRWIVDNAPARGTGWAPYPTSLRIVNWVKWFAAGELPRPQWVASLAVQARWLMRRLEWHLLGNHLFVNAKALVYAGLFFDGDEAAHWLQTGLAILERELPEQILADGAQFERSPMYHLLALEDVLDLVNVIEAFAPVASATPAASVARRLLPGLRHHAGPMLHWLRCLRHPDGTLARFNDCAEGIAPPPDDIERYAAALGIVAPHPAGSGGASAERDGVLLLQPSGYVRAARGAALALLDTAPIGPDYLPGHAHADTLSFELSVHGRAVIVNRGTSEYGTGPRRQLERGTAAHSTVQLGTHDSSEVWAGFRVGRRARPHDVVVDGWRIDAAHDGYAHLSGAPCHRRRWELLEGGLVVSDRIAPHSAEPAVARYHLAPGLTVSTEDPESPEIAAGAAGAAGGAGGSSVWVVRDGATAVARVRVVTGSASVESWQHARRFGELVPALTLAVRLDGGAAEVHWSWPA